jgi:hypothetical protein
MKIVVGLPLFSKRLVADLNEVAGKKEYVFFDTYNSKIELIKCLIYLPFCKGVFSMNGVTDKSGFLDKVLFFRKKLWMQWVGTDVLLAVERHQQNSILRKYIDYTKTKNVTDASWLQDELKTANILTDLCSYKYLPRPLTIPLEYEKVAALTYIAQNRQSFYGMEKVIELAITNPTIDFHIIGTHTSDFSIPKNVTCYGWLEEDKTLEMMKKYPVFLRLTEHDGLSVSVIEALNIGSEVVYSYHLPYAHCATASNYHDVFKQAVAKVNERSLKPNLEAIEYYRKEYDKKTVVLKLYNELKTYFEK